MISFQHVTKTFSRGRSVVTALEDVSLEIGAGETVGIVGESGSGKSTLLRLVQHLEAPTTGTVLVDGEDFSALGPREQRRRRQRIGMVFQQFNLLANATVQQNVAMPLTLQRRRDEAAVAEMLDFVRLTARRDQHPAQLSGGERQRVAIARALVTRPPLLLCDEPTSSLDSRHTEEVLETLCAVRGAFDTTIVLVSHELDVVKGLCERALVLEDGRLRSSTAVTPPPVREREGTYAEQAAAYLAGSGEELP
ncbi:MAG: ATP-binding cassette domain-containing protein [Brachybacterium tyrofermentans]